MEGGGEDGGLISTSGQEGGRDKAGADERGEQRDTTDAGVEGMEDGGAKLKHDEGERERERGSKSAGQEDGVGSGWEYVTKGSVTPSWQEISAHLRLLAQVKLLRRDGVRG